MRFVLFATPRFGALVLEGLVQRGMLPVAIVTNPDRPTGRKQVLTAPAVKQKALELGLDIPLLQPERLPEIYDELRALDADCFIVASYGKILKSELLQIPHRGTVGVHPSMLPLYRGPSPIQQVLLGGCAETGMSLFIVDAEVDHGRVIVQEALDIADDETYLTLEAKLATLGAQLLESHLEGWIDGDIEAKEQDHLRATFTHKFVVADGYIAWESLAAAMAGADSEAAHRIAHMIAALNPEPGTWTERDGVRMKLLSATIVDGRLVIDSYQKAGGVIQKEILK